MATAPHRVQSSTQSGGGTGQCSLQRLLVLTSPRQSEYPQFTEGDTKTHQLCSLQPPNLQALGRPLPLPGAGKGNASAWRRGSGRTHLQGFLGSFTLFLAARDSDDVTPPGRARVSLSPLPGVIAVLLGSWGEEGTSYTGLSCTASASRHGSW